jgi:large subunit ribosomal protein L21
MFAVIIAAGKQFRVAANDEIILNHQHGNPGATIAFPVLMLTADGVTTVGSPVLTDVTVAGEIVEHARGKKVIAFKKRRRQNSKRKRGYRDELTVVRITEILTGGKKPVMKEGVAVAAVLTAASAQLGKPAMRNAKAGGLVAGAGVVAAVKPAAVKKAGAAKSEARDTRNLSLIAGIGPTIEKKLRAAGVLNWEQIAAWSEADLAVWDGELKLRGRATREEWVEQAKELLAGKAPRAKIDQAEAKSGQDW